MYFTLLGVVDDLNTALREIGIATRVRSKSIFLEFDGRSLKIDVRAVAVASLSSVASIVNSTSAQGLHLLVGGDQARDLFEFNADQTHRWLAVGSPEMAVIQVEQLRAVDTLFADAVGNQTV